MAFPPFVGEEFLGRPGIPAVSSQGNFLGSGNVPAAARRKI